MDFAQKTLDKDRPININKDDYVNYPRNKKPFADFKMSELTHLNVSATKDYLKQQPRRTKFDKKPNANQHQTETFVVKKYQKSTPFSDQDFRNIAMKAK